MSKLRPQLSTATIENTTYLIPSWLDVTMRTRHVYLMTKLEESIGFGFLLAGDVTHLYGCQQAFTTKL